MKDRFNEHRRTIDNPNNKSKPTTAAQHFLSSPNHTANDMQLVPIEKIFSNRDSIRKAREAFVIQKGRTIDHRLDINCDNRSLGSCLHITLFIWSVNFGKKIVNLVKDID